MIYEIDDAKRRSTKSLSQDVKNWVFLDTCYPFIVKVFTVFDNPYYSGEPIKIKIFSSSQTNVSTEKE